MRKQNPHKVKGHLISYAWSKFPTARTSISVGMFTYMTVTPFVRVHERVLIKVVLYFILLIVNAHNFNCFMQICLMWTKGGLVTENGVRYLSTVYSYEKCTLYVR